MSLPPVDLRSDTVTRPTPAMREAMAMAEVGDDVYGEDPTVSALEHEAAAACGFEAALYMPSGSMCNQVALALHTRRGAEVICAEGSHIHEWELGAMAVIGGLSPRFVPAPAGVPDPDDVRRALRSGPFTAPTGLIALENTHNKAGGTVIPQKTVAAIAEVARGAGLPLHLDGARAFNAAVYLGLDIREVLAPFDTASICLSKGLGAPVGSVLLLPRALRAEAYRYRKMLGGGMRQAGVLAAAGLIALREGPALLAEDHRRTREFAVALQAAGYTVDMERVQTNIIYVEVEDAEARLARWRERGLLCSVLGPGAKPDSGPDSGTVRFVLHRDVDDAALARAVAAL